MAAFSYKQHQPFLVECAHVPFLPHQFEEMMSNASSSSSYSFLQYHAPDHHHAITDHYFSGPEPETYEETTNTHKARESLAALQTDFSKPEKKRKNIDGSCLTSLKSQKNKSRKQKKHTEGKKEKAAAVEMKEKKQAEEAPVGYIHVRARRGQATDSHSLAERVRREKISERMKLLQALVPGCDKVTGKAVMLDEIINYVQSLQNQIEFLSMKLASVSPMLYDFGVEFDGREMNQVEKMSSLPRIQQTCSPFLPNACHDQDTNSTPFLLHAQLPIISQENSGFLMGEQRQAFLSQVVDLSNKYNSLISAQLGM